MFEGERLPEGLADLPPGLELAQMLAGVDRSRLDGHERVTLLQARHRLRAHVEADLYADMMAVVEATGDELGPDNDLSEIQDSAASEIRAALTWTRRAAEYQLGFACLLLEDYPQVWEALHQGRIDLAKTRVIINQSIHLDPELRAKIVDIALEQASTQTTGLLAARIRRLAIWADPDTAKKRYDQGVKERRVVSEANDDGTANLYGLQLPAADTQAVMRRINRLARAARSKDDPRTMDQLRADVLLDLLHGRHQKYTRNGDHRGMVDLQVDLTTLAGLTENPGELNGYGPVIADIARQVAENQPDSEWRYTITDPTGAVVHNGTTRRRPSTAQQRHVEARNPTCVFPGCRMPAAECDLDHTHAWAEGGPTDTDNLAPLCRYDHRLKHQAGWKQEQNRPGTHVWTSPLGHTYTVGPDPP